MSSKTSIAGMLAAVANVAQAAIPAPSWLHAVLVGLAAGTLAALGYHARDGQSPTDAPLNPVPKLTRLPVAVFLAALLTSAVVLFTACAFVHATASRSIPDGQTNVVEASSVRALTFFDSGQAIARASARSGYATNGTWTPGVSLTGLDQVSSSTGAVSTVKILLQQLAPVAAP